MTCGDSFAQIFQHRQHQTANHDYDHDSQFQVDKRRLAKMVSWTIIGYIPMNFYAFRIIERILPDIAGSGSYSTLRKSGPRIVAKALLATSPTIFINPIFFAYSSTVEASIEAGTSSGDWCPDWNVVKASVFRRYREDLFPVLSTAVQLWVPVNLVNFTIVPPHFRVVTVSIVATLWNAYLSLVTHKQLSPLEKTIMV